ncbi:MAG: MFS transporter [Nitrospirota bacterium]
MKIERLPFHYGWVIVFTGTISMIACLGLGRFALGMLLPSMAVSLNLTYSEMGFISTGNFLGYLVSVLLSGMIASRIGPSRLIFVALLIIGCSMIMVSRTDDFRHVLLLYTVTGIGSGASNVPLMGLVSQWFTSRRRGRAAGFIVIGSGFAIIFSGKFIPFINNLYGTNGWRISWLLLGCIVIVIAFIAFLLLRDRPENIGLKPMGDEKTLIDESRYFSSGRSIYKDSIIYHLGAIYFLFGYTYVIYTTFVVTSLVRDRGFSEAVAGNFWAWVGFLSLFSGPVFGSLSDRLGRKSGLITVFSFMLSSYLLFASGMPGFFLYLSIFLFGVVAWSIPSIMAAAAGDYAGPQRAVAVFGFITFIFGLGQITGPAVAGLLAESTGSFSSSFYMAAIFAGVAILLTAFLRRPGH